MEECEESGEELGDTRKSGGVLVRPGDPGDAEKCIGLWFA